tara:strand:+ start:1181 stop:1348 length:168 start_codon:yes stop_codon:yes gene_type:complete
MNEVERKEYFKEYYLKSKRETIEKNIKDKKKRGRPKKVVPPFKIIKFDKPYIMIW